MCRPTNVIFSESVTTTTNRFLYFDSQELTRDELNHIKQLVEEQLEKIDTCIEEIQSPKMTKPKVKSRPWDEDDNEDDY